MFPLHSSADHAFVINRGVYNQKVVNASSSPYSFGGISGELVSWESVRLVKHLSPHVESCPICLDSFTCPRITKCGHSFCLICLIRHVRYVDDAYNHNNNKSHGPKCPCCSASLFLIDVRPVQFVTISRMNLKTNQRFAKLHRFKACSSPFLPRISCPRRLAPQALPSQFDSDAKFSRFNYVDLQFMHNLLQENLQQIQQLLQEYTADDDESKLCHYLALQFVQEEQKAALAMDSAEQHFQTRFLNPSAGIYQLHNPQLVLSEAQGTESGPDLSCLTISRSFDSDLTTSNNEMMEKHDLATTFDYDDTETPSSIIQAPHEPLQTWHPEINPIPQPPEEQPPKDENQKTCWTPGSIYLGDEENMFFQAEDGQLSFLCSFNIQCLQSEFSTFPPNSSQEDSDIMSNSHSPQQQHSHMEHPSNQQQQQQHQKQLLQRQPSQRPEPLPDSIEGSVLDVEHVILTRQMRQRLRFLSHLPLGTPIQFVEIAFRGNVISRTTKKTFSKQFAQRRQARERKSRAEKRLDDRAQKREEERLQDYIAQVPLVNRNFRSQPLDVTSDEFGPLLCPQTLTNSPPKSSPSNLPSLSFSAIAQKAEARDVLSQQKKNKEKASTNTLSRNKQRLSEMDFPALGSSSHHFPALGSPQPSSTWPRPKTVSPSHPSSGRTVGGNGGGTKKLQIYSPTTVEIRQTKMGG